jgi:hypothetical protein
MVIIEAHVEVEICMTADREKNVECGILNVELKAERNIKC